MKKMLVQSTFIAMVIALAACSATPVRRSMKESWTDTMTASKIRYKLMKDHDVKKSHMHVQVFRGDVTLTGRAVSDVEKTRAETVAKSVKHVTGVENYIHVVGDSPKIGFARVMETEKIKVTTPTGKEVITEKTIKDVPLTTVSRTPSKSVLPTIHEATGDRQPAILASRKAVEPKVASKVTPKAAPKVVAKSAPVKSSDTKLAAIRRDPPLAAPAKSVTPVTTATQAPVHAPIVTAPSVPEYAMPASVAPAATATASRSAAPYEVPAKVVGQSKTGLPWDGEVYEDDASRMNPVSKAPAAATRPAAIKTQVVSPAASGDDLAKEAAQELEKLRLKK